ncbi:MAG: HAD family hydrolase [Mycobacteriales bacterium]
MADRDVPGVLLDVDGTLVDTTYLHAVAWAEALAQQGVVVPTARVHALVGKQASALVEELGGTDLDTAKAAHAALYGQWSGHLRPLPGARALLEALSGRGHRLVLASSAAQDELAALEQALDAQQWLHGATSADDVDAGKPEPDVLHRGLELLGVPCAGLVGDAVWDGEAAARAGVPFVGLRCGGTSEQALRGAGAAEVWDDPADLLAHLDRSLLTA